jgi:hypothetical protein
MRAVKAWFLAIGLRERGLLTFFCFLVAVVVLVAFYRRGREAWTRDSDTLARLRQQQSVLDRRDAVEQRAREASTKLVPGESLSQVQLDARAVQYARQAGFAANTQPVNDANLAGSKLLIHAIRLSATNVAWKALSDFYTEILKRRPYIVIDEMTISLPNQRNDQHTVQMKLSSIEVLP